MRTIKVNFETYIKTFYTDIQVQSGNTNNPFITPIFYKIEEGNIYVIINYYNFYIKTCVSISKIKDKYNNAYGLDEEMEEENDFEEVFNWFNENYLDGRGVEYEETE